MTTRIVEHLRKLKTTKSNTTSSTSGTTAGTRTDNSMIDMNKDISDYTEQNILPPVDNKTNNDQTSNIVNVPSPVNTANPVHVMRNEMTNAVSSSSTINELSDDELRHRLERPHFLQIRPFNDSVFAQSSSETQTNQPTTDPGQPTTAEIKEEPPQDNDNKMSEQKEVDENNESNTEQKNIDIPAYSEYNVPLIEISKENKNGDSHDSYVLQLPLLKTDNIVGEDVDKFPNDGSVRISIPPKTNVWIHRWGKRDDGPCVYLHNGSSEVYHADLGDIGIKSKSLITCKPITSSLCIDNKQFFSFFNSGELFDHMGEIISLVNNDVDNKNRSFALDDTGSQGQTIGYHVWTFDKNNANQQFYVDSLCRLIRINTDLCITEYEEKLAQFKPNQYKFMNQIWGLDSKHRLQTATNGLEDNYRYVSTDALSDGSKIKMVKVGQHDHWKIEVINAEPNVDSMKKIADMYVGSDCVNNAEETKIIEQAFKDVQPKILQLPRESSLWKEYLTRNEQKARVLIFTNDQEAYTADSPISIGEHSFSSMVSQLNINGAVSSYRIVLPPYHDVFVYDYGSEHNGACVYYMHNGTYITKSSSIQLQYHSDLIVEICETPNDSMFRNNSWCEYKDYDIRGLKPYFGKTISFIAYWFPILNMGAYALDDTGVQQQNVGYHMWSFDKNNANQQFYVDPHGRLIRKMDDTHGYAIAYKNGTIYQQEDKFQLHIDPNQVIAEPNQQWIYGIDDNTLSPQSNPTFYLYTDDFKDGSAILVSENSKRKWNIKIVKEGFIESFLLDTHCKRLTTVKVLSVLIVLFCFALLWRTMYMNKKNNEAQTEYESTVGGWSRRRW